ncbi:MAG: hypothetical protein ACFUZC_18675 [Chthoniobacteraceae bacterium]
MMKLSLLLAALLVAITAQAQTPIPLPTAPLVAPFPALADWTVTVQVPPGLRPANLQILEVRSTATPDLKRDRVTYTNHATEERWYAGTLLLLMMPGGRVFASDLSGTPFSDSMEATVPTGFPGVNWIKLGAFAGAERFGNHLCDHYAQNNREAWIDSATKLPVAYKDGDGILYRFQFNPLPAEALALPPAYQKTADRCLERAERRKRIEAAAEGK